MTKSEFLSILERRLHALPENERRDAIEYYEGYIDDAEDTEAVAIERLGPPNEVAANILAEYALVEAPKTEQPRKRGISIAWAVILAVFAAPIGLPLAVAVAAVAFALLITMFSLVVAFGATAIGLTVGGVFSIVFGVIALFQNLPLAVMVLGGALVVLGLGILFIKLTTVLAKSGFQAVARFAGKFIMRREKI